MSNLSAPFQINPAWSVMRCVFAFEICLIHVCSKAWHIPQDGWLAETVFIALTRTGTVGFMMLAGAILIARGPGDVGGYLSYRLRRWLPAILTAQALYLGLGLFVGGESLSDLGWFNLVEPAWYHIWFFYALALIYVMVVPMRHYDAWAQGLQPVARQVALWAPVALLLAVLAWATLLRGGAWGDLRPLNLVVYCGYAWTGHVLCTCFPRGVPKAGWLLAGGVAGSVVATVLATDAAGHPVSHYFHRCTVFIAVAAIGQFLLLLRLRPRSWSMATMQRINRVAHLTLGIFIVHPLVITLSGWPHPWALAGSYEWISMPAAAVTLFLISGAITWAAVSLLALLRGGLPLGMAHRAR